MSSSVPPEVFNKALDGIVCHERGVAGEAIAATDIEPHRHPERLGIQLTKKRKLGFECRLLGAERKSILGDWMSVHSHKRKFEHSIGAWIPARLCAKLPRTGGQRWNGV
jgi:hypothetical protein